MNRLCTCAVGVSLLTLVLGACGRIAPAVGPQQLQHTPGPAITLLSDTYTGPEFRAWYPPGWRVITSPAYSPSWVIFVDPDERALIALAAEERDASPLPANTPVEELYREVVSLTLPGNLTLTAALAAPAGDDVYGALFLRVIGSIAEMSTESKNR